jgi:hypothetical protein
MWLPMEESSSGRVSEDSFGGSTEDHLQRERRVGNLINCNDGGNWDGGGQDMGQRRNNFLSMSDFLSRRVGFISHPSGLCRLFTRFCQSLNECEEFFFPEMRL